MLRGCIEEESSDKQESTALTELAIRCSENLSGMNPKQLLLQTEANENERLKYFFMAQGGVLTLCAVFQKAKYKQIKDSAEKILKQWMSEKDWNVQLQILEMWAASTSNSDLLLRFDSKTKIR